MIWGPGTDVLVVAPHPDDETLGCGGTLIRQAREGCRVHWLIMTKMTDIAGYSPREIQLRAAEIERVSAHYGFASVTQLDFCASTLDEVPLRELIEAVAATLDRVKPNILCVPYPHDAHSDHERCFRASSACAKWFRRRQLSCVAAYEVPSETGFRLDPHVPAFRPNLYVCIDQELERKVDIFKTYASEIGQFPFPRSEETIVSLARLRGSECGVAAAEAFILLRQTV